MKKETLAQVFSCKFCEISKNAFFHRTPLVAAFANKIRHSCMFYAVEIIPIELLCTCKSSVMQMTEKITLKFKINISNSH